MRIARPSDLDSPDLVRSQRREWRFERSGWVVMGLVLAASALGLFGDGPLAGQRVRDGALEVRYDRFVRRATPTTLVITVSAPLPGESLAIGLVPDSPEDVPFRFIHPAPRRSYSQSGALVLVFDAAGAGPYRIWAQAEPARTGNRRALILAGQDSVRIHQFVYP